MVEYREHSIAVNEMRRVNHIYFVGIGGAGMSGIAEVLHNIGYQVSGSDIMPSQTTSYLSSLGIKIKHQHHEAQIEGCDVIVVSSAVANDNPELIGARRRRIPVVPRAEMLAELMRFKKSIAVAGTHGKTTVTSLIAGIFARGGLDPTYVIGGLLNGSNSRARLGSGKYLIAEADESDVSFLHLQPILAVVTNIDTDHLENYGSDINALEQSFLEFLHHLPFYGLAVICLDDERIRNMMPAISKTFKTYGFDPDADYCAHNIHYEAQKSSFHVACKDRREWLKIELNLPGKFNILNALAAIAIAHEEGIADEMIISALAEFEGISRRYEFIGKLNIHGCEVLVIDDYAHHPSEISAVLETVHQGWPDHRIIVIFQPHRYTRTISLFDDFCQVLSDVDQLLLLEVYAASEQPIANADSRSLCRAIRQRGKLDPIFVEQHEQLPLLLESIVKQNDLLLILGAGDIEALSAKLVQRYG